MRLPFTRPTGTRTTPGFLSVKQCRVHTEADSVGASSESVPGTLWSAPLSRRPVRGTSVPFELRGPEGPGSVTVPWSGASTFDGVEILVHPDDLGPGVDVKTIMSSPTTLTPPDENRNPPLARPSNPKRDSTSDAVHTPTVCQDASYLCIGTCSGCVAV